MASISEILNKAAERGKKLNLPYAGALLPQEAFELMQKSPGAKLVDVRTQAEWDYVGRIPGSLQIEWQTYPGSKPNPNFLTELQAAQSDKEAVVMFLCRSGARSHAASAIAAQAGYAHSYNVLEGFEGDKDANGHRNAIGGWRVAGLPWVQS